MEEKRIIKIRCKHDKMMNPALLKPHPLNRNKHPDKQIDRLIKLYEGHGVRHPIIISNQSGYIVAGHGRRLAAMKGKMEEFPVEFQDFDSEELEYAFLQADNASALWAELDLSGINADIIDLGPDFDLDLLGIEGFKLDVSERNTETGTFMGEMEWSKELDEKNDYLVLLFRSKESFARVCDAVGIKKVRTNLSRSGNPKFEMAGTGRLVDGERAIKKIQDLQSELQEIGGGDNPPSIPPGDVLLRGESGGGTPLPGEISGGGDHGNPGGKRKQHLRDKKLDPRE